MPGQNRNESAANRSCVLALETPGQANFLVRLEILGYDDGHGKRRQRPLTRRHKHLMVADHGSDRGGGNRGSCSALFVAPGFALSRRAAPCPSTRAPFGNLAGFLLSATLLVLACFGCGGEAITCRKMPVSGIRRARVRSVDPISRLSQPAPSAA
jgi:hypothetical protein